MRESFTGISAVLADYRQNLEPKATSKPAVAVNDREIHRSAVEASRYICPIMTPLTDVMCGNIL